MEKHIRVVDQQRGIVQITTVDSRWYARPTTDQTTGLPIFHYVPSCTWICGYYPKGEGFIKWVASHGYDEAQVLKEAAGDKGSKVHAAIAALIAGQGKTHIAMDEPILNPSTGHPEPLTLEEYQAVMSFVNWFADANPTTVAADVVIWNDADGYAGTVDYVCRIDGQLWVIDFKTSKSIYPPHRMQVSAYQHANPDWKDAKLAILQLGYERNKLGYKFTEVEDCYELFLHTKAIWATETTGQAPMQRDFPLSLTLTPNQEAPCAPSEGDGKTTNGSLLMSGSPDASRKSSTTPNANTTSSPKKPVSGARPSLRT